jgi:hypothetical protein
MSKRLIAFLLVLFLLLTPSSALAQDYYFSLPNYNIHVYWNEDGTMAIDYVFDFANDPSGHAIEYVDVGIPNGNFRVNDIYADVNGQRLTDISRSGYEGQGTGVAVGLGRNSIPPGGRGEVHVFIARVEGVLNTDTTDPEYASAVFSPTWFGSRYVYGTTNMAVTFHLPPGVQPDEPRWHSAPAGFPQEPDTGIDEDGRVLYTWRNPNAAPDRQYLFGASFPKRYVPEQAFQAPVAPSDPFGFAGSINFDCLIPFLCMGFFGLIFGAAIWGERKRKLQYLPPKISIEGHGIKRGLTAVEAAILMEQSMDKVMTMILFSTIKKNAATVLSRDPLRLQLNRPLPEDLRTYETEFLQAFEESTDAARQRKLQAAMVALIKSVSQKMKGFSRRETLAYYRDIMEKAWLQVEAADTPEVKSQKFDENMEWTMLDKDYDRRTRDVFRTGPVFIPTWWGRYDPGYGRTTSSGIPSTTAPTSSGGGLSRPNLPGGEFAASMVGGVQSFSSKVVGNISDFTSRVTSVTNPPPPPSSRSTGSRGGGGGCACACACAGCACACAGGGR